MAISSILVAPRFKKSFKIRSWVPSPQMPYFGGPTSPTPQRLEIIPPGLQIMLRAAMSRPEESNDWTLVKRRRENAAAPSQLQIDDQERQR